MTVSVRRGKVAPGDGAQLVKLNFIPAAPTEVAWPHNKRRHQRFVARARVRFSVAEAWHIATTANLSLGGMLLTSPVPLAQGDQTKFCLDLEDSAWFGGVVSALTEAGAHVAFTDIPLASHQLLRQYIRDTVVPELEYKIAGADDDSAALTQLAGIYRDLDRPDHALGLYRTALQVGDRDEAFFITLADFYLHYARHLGAQGLPVLDELGVLASSAPQLCAAARARLDREIATLRHELAPSAAPPSAESLAALQASIEADRQRLYREFEHLLARRAELHRFQQSVPKEVHANPGLSTREAQVLESIRSKVDEVTGRRDSPLRRAKRVKRGIAIIVGLGAATVVAATVSHRRPTRGVAPPAPVASAPSLEQVPLPPAPPPLPQLVLEPSPPPTPERSTPQRRTARRSSPRKATPAPPSAIEQQYEAAAKLLRERKMLLAVRAFHATLELDERHAGAYQGLGIAYLLLGQQEKAVKALRRFVALEPDHPGAERARQIIAEQVP